MESARYRLRFVIGASDTAATYGSSEYGGDISYGQRASDPMEYNVYIPVPMPGGYPESPAWFYRRGDTLPAFRAKILAEKQTPLNLQGVTDARLFLRPLSLGRVTQSFPLAFEDRAKGIVRRDWVAGDLLIQGTFMAAIVLDYTSGRRLTIPYDSRMTFTVSSQDVLPV